MVTDSNGNQSGRTVLDARAWFLAQTAEFHERQMQLAIKEAQKAAADDEVPMGCVIIALQDDGSTKIVGKAHNSTEALKDPTAHAEVLAITQAAAAVGDWRLTNCALYVTKEPCPMCGGAIVLARLPLVVWAASDPKRGAGTVFKMFDHAGLNHHPSVLPDVCSKQGLELLQSFFRARRGH